MLQEFLGFHGFTWEDNDIAGHRACARRCPASPASLRRMSRALLRLPGAGRRAGRARPACRSSTTTRRRSAPTASPTPSAAFDLYGGPTIVVDFGTATTFEAISAKGEYLGGAIFPGIDISLDALFGRAAALRRVELVEPRNVIGTQHGRVDAVGRHLRLHVARRRHVRAHRATSSADATVVATGGLSGLIGPLSSAIPHLEPWLTLHGLRLIYEKNQACMTAPVPVRGHRHHRRRCAPQHDGARRRRGDRHRRHRRRPGHAPPRRRASSPSRTLRDGSGARSSSSRRPTVTDDFDGFTKHQPRRLDRRHRRGREDPKTGELSVKVATLGACSPRPGAASATSGTASPTSTRATASATSTCGPTRRAAPTFLQRSRILQPHAPLARGPRLHRGGDAGLPPDPRRRAGQAVHHPPQRARHGPLPAHRARALPEAAHRRRLRAGVRDRPGCSATRACRPGTTPSSRCSSSTRPTPTTAT